jgi:hypothetical protein
MRKIASLIDHELTWMQRKGIKSEYELRFGDDLVAILRFPKMLSSTAIAESGDGCWTFERVGFLKPKTVIRASGSADDLATYAPKAWKGGGVLELPGGRNVTLYTSTWGRTLGLRMESGETLLESKGRGFFRFAMDVRMYRTAAQLPEFPWMVMLAFYQAIMMRREAAAHSAAH